MIVSNVYERVFFIKAEAYGTAFTIDVDNKQYLITAKHLLKTPEETFEKIFHNEKWNDIKVQPVGTAWDEIDVTVFSPEIQLSKPLLLKPTLHDIAIGQDVFLVGYPYKMWTHAEAIMNSKSFPFIKKGTHSSAFERHEPRRLYIDVINNEGFSGGSVVFQPQSEANFCVGGIISKFKTEYENVLDKEGEPNGMTVAYNTGFTVAYDIKYAVELIQANPCGCVLK